MPAPTLRVLAESLKTSAPNSLRRRLVFGLPGTLAFASPLALVACGGGDDSTDAGSTAPAGNTDTTPPGPLATSAISVQIQLPDALVAGAGALQVVTATGNAPVVGGSATLNVVSGGPQLVNVVGADGYTRLMGWAGTGQPPISVQSTAAVLLYFGLGLPFLGMAARDALRARLATQGAVTVFAQTIATELAADPKALSRASAGVAAGFDQAASALLPASASAAAGKSHRLGLIIDPATDKSGAQVVQGDTLNTFFVDNTYVRRAVVVVNREAWVDSAGVEHLEPSAPVQVGEVMPLPLPTAIDSVANVVGGWANEYYASEDPNGFWRSVSDTVTLDITPTDAKRTRYNVVLLCAGYLPPADPARFARLPASQRAYVTGLDLDKNLNLQTFLLDFLAPMFFEFLSSRVGASAKQQTSATGAADKAVLQAFAAQMLTILQTRMPDLVQKVSAGEIGPWAAFVDVLKACTFNPDTGEVSPLLQEFLTQGATLLAKALTDVGMRSRVLEIATGLQLGNRNVLGLLPVLQILQKFDLVLGKAAQLRIVADVLDSKRMEEWSVIATKAKVVLKPNPLEVETTGVTYPVTVEIVDNDNDDYGREKGSISFDWDCTGQYGSLYSPVDTGLSKPNKFTTSAANATTNYLPNGKPADGAPETISVRAYFEPIGSGGTRSLIGSATTTLKFKKAFSLKITPVTTDLRIDSTIGVSASIVEDLPANADVRYEFSLRSGGGRIQLTGTDSDTRHGFVEYTSPADETTAVVECVATVTVQGLAMKTDAATSTIQVKKGLKTITVEGNWVYEKGIKLRAMEDCFIDAAGSRVCATGWLDDWVIYQIPKVAGAVSYTIRLLTATGSERVRYGFPTGNYSSDVLDDGGGVLRIKYWAADSPFGSSNGVSNYSQVEANMRAYLLGRVATDGPRIVADVVLGP